MLGEPMGTIPAVRNFGADGTLRCVHGLTPKYLKLAEVQKALHGKYEWGTRKFRYRRSLDSTIPMMRQLIANYHVTIYNGDADACVPYPTAFELFEILKYKTKKPWRPWTLEEPIKYTSKPAVAGYFTEYETGHAGTSLTFITIKDSGHLVPHWTPLAAWEM